MTNPTTEVEAVALKAAVERTKQDWVELLFEVQAGSRSCRNMADLILAALSLPQAAPPSLVPSEVEGQQKNIIGALRRDIEAWKERWREARRGLNAAMEATADLIKIAPFWSVQDWPDTAIFIVIDPEGCEVETDLTLGNIRALAALSRPQPEPVTAQPQPDVGRLVEALEAARRQFLFYAEEHLKKGTADGDAKATTNAAFARDCAQALTAYRQSQPSTTSEPQS